MTELSHFKWVNLPPRDITREEKIINLTSVLQGVKMSGASDNSKYRLYVIY